MQYAAHALGLKDFNTFVIANGIFASMLTGGQTYSCRVRYISLSPMNICRLEALNTLSRRIVAGLDDPLEIETELDRIQSFEASSNKVKILCAGFGSGGFCYLFGGSFLTLRLLFWRAVFCISSYYMYCLNCPFQKSCIISPQALSPFAHASFCTLSDWAISWTG